MGIGCPGTGIIGGCEALCGCWELNPNPLGGQLVLFTGGPFLYSCTFDFKLISICDPQDRIHMDCKLLSRQLVSRTECSGEMVLRSQRAPPEVSDERRPVHKCTELSRARESIKECNWAFRRGRGKV